MSEPTDTQSKVLAYVKSRIQEGLPPTRQEISRHFGWTTHAAADGHLRLLEKKGLLRLQPRVNRGIFLPKQETALDSVR